MVHAYHVILPHDGFWLPNDPRGSWSLFVASWELVRFGKTVSGGGERDQIGGDQAARSGYAIHACAILPEHTHLVIARHRY